DLQPSRLTGPVVLATDLGPSSAAAARFAGERAREWGRPLLVVHVLPAADTGLTFLPREAQEGARSARHQSKRDEASAGSRRRTGTAWRSRSSCPRARRSTSCSRWPAAARRWWPAAPGDCRGWPA